MKRVFIIVNILLLFLTIFKGWQFFKVWSAESALSFIETRVASSPVLPYKGGGNKLPPAAGRLIDKSDKKKDIQRTGVVLSDMSFEREGEKLLPLRETFAGVIEKNLFHIHRVEGADEVKVEPPSSSLSKSKPKPIIMEGLVIIGNYKAAVIRDSAPQGKGGRPTRRVRVGDTIEDQKVTAIMEDRIIVKGEEGERVIKLHDSDKPLRPQITVRTEGTPAQTVPSEMPPVPPPQTP